MKRLLEGNSQKNKFITAYKIITTGSASVATAVYIEEAVKILAVISRKCGRFWNMGGLLLRVTLIVQVKVFTDD